MQITVELTDREHRRLEHLARAMTERDREIHADPPEWSVQDVLTHTLHSLDAAIRRAGSWERSAFYPVFAEALEAAEEEMFAAGDDEP